MFAHTTMVCVRYMIMSVENRDKKDERSCGGIFFDLCAEAKTIQFLLYVLLHDFVTQKKEHCNL